MRQTKRQLHLPFVPSEKRNHLLCIGKGIRWSIRRHGSSMFFFSKWTFVSIVLPVNANLTQDVSLFCLFQMRLSIHFLLGKKTVTTSRSVDEDFATTSTIPFGLFGRQRQVLCPPAHSILAHFWFLRKLITTSCLLNVQFSPKLLEST
jgi:hypothetical protein